MFGCFLAKNQEALAVAILGTAADLGCDLNLLLQLSILCILAIGFNFGRKKSFDNLRRHWTTMAAASVLNLAGFAFVMAPAMWSFLAKSPVELGSVWAITSLPHGALGILDGALILSLGTLFFAKRSPQKMKTWMRAMFIIWIVNIAIGISLYLQMAGFI
jgi:uncharacterized membrane protein YozB (DUF420 family)